MFMGEFHHNIDDKARIVMPSKFREELGDTFVITRGLEGCLFVYSKDEWKALVEKCTVKEYPKDRLKEEMELIIQKLIT